MVDALVRVRVLVLAGDFGQAFFDAVVGRAITDIDATQHPAIVFHTILSRIIALDEFKASTEEVH